MSMVFDISLYSLTYHLVSKGSNKLSIFTEFLTQKFILNLCVSLKNFLCTHTFENAQHISNRIFGWYRTKYLYMIVYCFNLFYFTAPRCQYLFKQFFLHCFAGHISIPTCGTWVPKQNEMISCVMRCMTQFFNSNAVHNTTFLNKGNPFIPVLAHGAFRVSFL